MSQRKTNIAPQQELAATDRRVGCSPHIKDKQAFSKCLLLSSLSSGHPGPLDRSSRASPVSRNVKIERYSSALSCLAEPELLRRVVQRDVSCQSPSGKQSTSKGVLNNTTPSPRHFVPEDNAVQDLERQVQASLMDRVTESKHVQASSAILFGDESQVCLACPCRFQW